MTAALQERCDLLQDLLERANADEVETRYRAGEIVAAVRDGKGTYGDRGVEQLAAALHKHRGTLYRYAAVADFGPWSKMRPLLQQPNRDGEALSWSHWLELARMGPAWRPWYTRALVEAWTVRELCAHLDLALDGRIGGGDAVDTTAGAFAESMRAIERFRAEVTGALDAVLDRIERDASRERARQVPEQLARATDLMESAHEKTGLLLARIRRLAGERSGAPPRRLTHANQA